MTPNFKTLVPAKVTSEPKEVRRWWIRPEGISKPCVYHAAVYTEQDLENAENKDFVLAGIPVVEATALTEAERTVAILRDKQTQHESTLLETVRVRDEAEREIVELRKEIASIIPTIVGNVKFTQATAGTWEKPGEAEREIAILRDKQTQHESTLLETMRVRDEAEREIAELRKCVDLNFDLDHKWRTEYYDMKEALKKEVAELQDDNDKWVKHGFESMETIRELRTQVEVAVEALEKEFTDAAETCDQHLDESEGLHTERCLRLGKALASIKGGPYGKV